MNINAKLVKFALIYLLGSSFFAQAATVEKAVLLMPPAPQEPRINGPLVYGSHPGHPFLYRIPCTGKRSIIFPANNLPQGLVLDAKTGIITGTTPVKGSYVVTFKAKNSYGTFKIVAGNTLALTPPMGWNSWYIHYHRITEAMMRAAADQMIASGMADYGYQYVRVL